MTEEKLKSWWDNLPVNEQIALSRAYYNSEINLSPFGIKIIYQKYTN